MRLPLEHAVIPRTGPGAWLAPRSNGARLHAGVDLACIARTPVYAPCAGVVVVAQQTWTPSQVLQGRQRRAWQGYGPCVVMIRAREPYAGLATPYVLIAHMDSMSVTAGDVVSEGARIGSAGSLHHVHLEVRDRVRQPGDAAVIEICGDPRRFWGAPPQWHRWEHADGCPANPSDSPLTPRACRPGARDVTPLPT